MRDYAKISCTLWGSRKFKSLPDDDCRLLYLYLHTCPHVNLVGCYVLRPGYAVSDLGWDDGDTGLIRYQNCIETLTKANLIGHDRAENLIRIVDFLHHDPFCNPKHAAAGIKTAMKLPDCQEKQLLLVEIAKERHAKSILGQYGLDTVSEQSRYPEPEPEPEPEPNPEPNPEPEPEPEPAAEGPQTMSDGKGEDRPLQFRQKVIAALGLNGDEITTSGTFPVQGMDSFNWPMRLAVWDQHGLTDNQILMAIKGKLAQQREKKPDFKVNAIKYFDDPIADFARAMKAGKASSNTSSVSQKTETPEQRRKRIARMIGG